MGHYIASIYTPLLFYMYIMRVMCVVCRYNCGVISSAKARLPCGGGNCDGFGDSYNQQVTLNPYHSECSCESIRGITHRLFARKR